MEQHFFKIPWAANGDKAKVSDASNADGTVSYSEGWGPDYEKDMDADAHAKAVERDAMNAVLNAITVALRQYQTAAFPEFITVAENARAAFSYSAGVVVRYRATADVPFKNYVSLINNNTATPGDDAAKWQEFMFAEASDKETADGTSGVLIISPRRLKKVTDGLEKKIEESINTSVTPFILPVGAIIQWPIATPPEGWLECNGQAFNTSNNPEMLALFPAGRVPDLRGRFIRAWDNGAGIDPDSSRAILSEQEDLNKSHEHDLQLIFEHRNGIPDELLIKQGIPKSQAIYEVLGADKNDQCAFIARNDYTKARESGGVESRPKNAALMYIIKTDQAEAETGEPAPTAIVITPASLKLEAGTKSKFSATVLPAAIGINFPVSWAVSDPSMGSIDASGEYTSLAGTGGKQTIIASISTGLTSTATVTQEVYLTSIDIGAVPSELLVDQSYDIAINFSPEDFSETVTATSSDSAIATLTSSGTLFIAGEGTATLALTGSSSGVTTSIVVKTKAVEEIPVYLEIDNNLSEIAAAGVEAQEAARKNIGLGELATKSELTAEDVGAVSQAKESLPADTDLDSLTRPGDYFQNVTSNATTANHYPEEVAGAVRVVGTGVDDGACRQFYWPYNSDKEYRRFAFGDPLVFSEWKMY